MFRYTSIISILLAAAFTATSPVCFANTNISAEQKLGKNLYFDKNLSLNRNQACASCHTPGSAFVDPRNTAINQFPPPLHTPVSGGSVDGLFGTRNAPSAAYALYSPFFHWDGNVDSTWAVNSGMAVPTAWRSRRRRRF